MKTAPGSTSVRVGKDTYELARRLGEASGRTIGQVIEEAVAGAARREFLARFNSAFARLKGEPAAHSAYDEEQRELEGTLSDGLDAEDDWSFLVGVAPDALTFEEDEASAPAR